MFFIFLIIALLPSCSLSKSAKKNMVFIPAGKFILGNDYGFGEEIFSEEAGSYEVKIDGFYMDKYEVTNDQFFQFVKETGYKTLAERQGFSAVFISPKEVKNLDDMSQWWYLVAGANWLHPLGQHSNINGKMDHPVVHVAFEDALLYAQWAKKELPTEAQWEYAAKESNFDIKNTNTFQGVFPIHDTGEDGFVGTAPVGSFPKNPFGLYDIIGNVWEIVKDNFRPGHIACHERNPQGPKKSFDPSEPKVKKHVIKGGSFLCSKDYCMRYRPESRMGQDFTLGTSHIGFRTVINLPD